MYTHKQLTKHIQGTLLQLVHTRYTSDRPDAHFDSGQSNLLRANTPRPVHRELQTSAAHCLKATLRLRRRLRRRHARGGCKRLQLCPRRVHALGRGRRARQVVQVVQQRVRHVLVFLVVLPRRVLRPPAAHAARADTKLQQRQAAPQVCCKARARPPARCLWQHTCSRTARRACASQQSCHRLPARHALDTLQHRCSGLQCSHTLARGLPSRAASRATSARRLSERKFCRSQKTAGLAAARARRRGARRGDQPVLPPSG